MHGCFLGIQVSLVKRVHVRGGRRSGICIGSSGSASRRIGVRAGRKILSRNIAFHAICVDQGPSVFVDGLDVNFVIVIEGSDDLAVRTRRRADINRV